MATILAFSNRKGGVGKTTTTINVGAALARLGYSVLLVDLDPQYNLTRSLRVDASKGGNTYEILQHNAKPLAQNVAPNLDVIPTTKDLAFTEVALFLEDGKEQRQTSEPRQILSTALAQYCQGYDFVLIDTASALGLLTINALVAADYVIVPTIAEYLALEGVTDLVEIVEQVRQGLNKRLTLAGVLLTMYDNRPLINRQAKDNLIAYVAKYGQGSVLTHTIRKNVAVAEAQAFGLDLYRYDESSKAAADYMAATKELLTLIKTK